MLQPVRCSGLPKIKTAQAEACATGPLLSITFYDRLTHVFRPPTQLALHGFRKTARTRERLHHSLKSSDPALIHSGRFVRLGCRPRFGPARAIALHPRHPLRDVSEPPLDNASIRRIRLGGRYQPAFSVFAFARSDRSFRRFRSADPDGL